MQNYLDALGAEIRNKNQIEPRGSITVNMKDTTDDENFDPAKAITAYKAIVQKRGYNNWSNERRDEILKGKDTSVSRAEAYKIADQRKDDFMGRVTDHNAFGHIDAKQTFHRIHSSDVVKVREHFIQEVYDEVGIDVFECRNQAYENKMLQWDRNKFMASKDEHNTYCELLSSKWLAFGYNKSKGHTDEDVLNRFKSYLARTGGGK